VQTECFSSVTEHTAAKTHQLWLQWVSDPDQFSLCVSPPDPPFAPGIELGLAHYTVAMGTLTPPLTKWEPRKAELLIRMSLCVWLHTSVLCLLLIWVPIQSKHVWVSIHYLRTAWNDYYLILFITIFFFRNIDMVSLHPMKTTYLQNFFRMKKHSSWKTLIRFQLVLTREGGASSTKK